MMSTKPSQNQAKWTAPVMMKDCEIYCPSTCVALGPLFTDGDSKLIVAHGGQRGINMKLKVFQGIELHSDSSLADMPIAIMHFVNEKSSIPSVAVAAGPSLLIYKNLKPFYKFTSTSNRANETEEQVWAAVTNKEINMDTFLHALINISEQISFSHMAPLSQTYILADHENRLGLLDRYASKFVNSATITCLSKVTKSNAETIDVILVGTEQCDLHIVDSQAWTIYHSLKIPSIPVTICSYGYFMVDYRVFVQTRDSLVFVVRKGVLDPKAIIVSQSMITSMVLMNKLIVFATNENIINFHNFRGKKINNAQCPAKIKMLEPFHHVQKELHAVFAVFDKEVRMYDEEYLRDIQKFEKPVAWVKFGCYGREESTLLTCFKDGSIALQIFRRLADFKGTQMDYNPRPPVHALKLAIPKKTKVFIDQTNREMQFSNKIHQNYQKELFNLRFKVAEVYSQLISSASATVSTSSATPIEIAVDIHGFGPSFRMNIHLLSSSKQNLYDMHLSIISDPELYEFSTPLIPVVVMAPTQSYTFTTLLLCKDPEKAANCEIRALLISPEKPTPIVTAVIKMPFSEFPLD